MRQLLCIVCPNGCQLCVEEGASGFTVSGNRCSKGLDFAAAEIADPRRSLTTTVRTSFKGVPVLPVRTSGEIPKGRMHEVMKFISSVTVNRPLGIGETVVENILDLGVDIIVSSNVLKEEEHGA